jgi:ABC-type transport system involved in cytochrome c biogenesis permease subunit
MSWQAFYLGCFGVGLVLSVVSFLSGAVHLHLPVKWHLHVPATHSGAAHPGSASRGVVRHGAVHFPLFNSASLMIFLAWFGGVGFLLTTHSRLWFLTILALAMVAGLAGAALVAVFMVKVLDNPDAALEPMDFQMVGAVGKVNIAIRLGGTGEIVYVQGGTRRSLGARSENGAALEKGAEVVIARFERGIAYVRLWDEFTKEG